MPGADDVRSSDGEHPGCHGADHDHRRLRSPQWVRRTMLRFDVLKRHDWLPQSQIDLIVPGNRERGQRAPAIELGARCVWEVPLYHLDKVVSATIAWNDGRERDDVVVHFVPVPSGRLLCVGKGDGV